MAEVPLLLGLLRRQRPGFPALRYVPFGMTQGRVGLPFAVVVEEGRTAAPSATPGFPVNLRSVGEAHAAFFKESRKRVRVRYRLVGNPGYARDEQTAWAGFASSLVGPLFGV
jgi:hypothetical protein